MKKQKVSLSEQHITFQLLPEVKEICRHFFQNTGLQHFYYARYQAEKKQIAVVTTIPHFNRHVLSNKLVNAEQEWMEGIHYLPSFKYSKERAEMGTRFNVDQTLEIVNHEGAEWEIFGFAMKCEQEDKVNFYFNHIQELTQFTHEFKEQAQDLMTRSLAEAVPLLDFKETPSYPVEKQKLLLDGQQEVYLTARELQVLKGLWSGLSAKENAKLLDLSPRTIESYLEHIKNKLRVNNKAELIKLSSKYKLFN